MQRANAKPGFRNLTRHLLDGGSSALLFDELDSIYAHLFGLSRDDFAYILDHFPIIKRKYEAVYGEHRTARLCLEAYDRFGSKMR
jgi:hypothetical protein